MAKLSACLIVKDEIDMLEPCLQSLKGIVDEVIVVDTGSTDGTIELIQKYDVKLHHFEWVNDFAAARNFSISHATGDYVLIIDADERLEKSSASLLKKFVDDNDFDIGLVPLHQATSRDAPHEDVVEGRMRTGNPVLLPRVMTLKKEWEYKGNVHESPCNEFQKGAVFMLVPVHFVHHGAEIEWRDERQKNERNLELIQEQIKDYHDSPLHWGYLISELMHAGKHREVRRAIEKGWAVTKKAISENTTYPISFMAAIYPQYCFEQGRHKEAFESLKLVLKYCGNDDIVQRLNPNILYTCGSVLLNAEIPEEYKGQCYIILDEVADLLIIMRNMPYLEEQIGNYTSLRAYELKGASQLFLKKFEEALKSFEAALEFEAKDLSVRLFVAETYIEQSRFEEALTLLLELMNQSEKPDAWILASVACLTLGLDMEAREFWLQAEYRIGNLFANPHRKNLLNGLRGMYDLLEGKPIPGKGVYGVLGSIASRKPLKSTTQVPTPILAQVVDRFLELERYDLLEPFFEPRAQHILPGIKEWVQDYMAHKGFEIEYDEIMPIVCVGGNVDPKVLTLLHRTSRLRIHNVSDAEFEMISQIPINPQAFYNWINQITYNPLSERCVLAHPKLHTLFTKISDVAPETRFIFAYPSPRQLISTLSGNDLKEALADWMNQAVFMHKSISPSSLRCFSDTDFFIHGKETLDELFAALGETWSAKSYEILKKLQREEVVLNDQQDDLLIQVLREYAIKLQENEKN